MTFLAAAQPCQTRSVIGYCLEGISCMNCIIPVCMEGSLVLVMRNIKSLVSSRKLFTSNFIENTVQLIQWPSEKVLKVNYTMNSWNGNELYGIAVKCHNSFLWNLSLELEPSVKLSIWRKSLIQLLDLWLMMIVSRFPAFPEGNHMLKKKTQNM